MRGRTKLVSLGTMLIVLLTASMVFASGLVDVSRVSLLSGLPIGPLDSTADVFVDPVQIVKDYRVDTAYRIGGTFAIYMNITGVTDLFTYQVNVTWNPAMLHFIGLGYDEFLARTGSPDGTSRIEPTYVASNVTGYASIAETILGDYAGITGSGRLVAVQFEIVGYGFTDIAVSTGGILPTKLLDSTGAEMTFTKANGYFRNTIPGDIRGAAVGSPPDATVDYYDLVTFASSYLKSTGQPGFIREADLRGATVGSLPDGTVDYYDLVMFASNYLKSVSLP